MVTDNQNVVRILQVGSRKPDLQSEALAIFSRDTYIWNLSEFLERTMS